MNYANQVEINFAVDMSSLGDPDSVSAVAN